MKNSKRFLDTSNELILQRHSYGIKLIKPERAYKNSSWPSLGQVFNMPLPFYLMDTKSIIQNLNENTVKIMGLLSSNDAIGKTAKEIADIIGRSKRTVEHHLEKIKLKTGSSSKSELIEKIIDERFV